MSSAHYIAVDLGGTQIRAARFSASHEMETRVAVDTGADEGFDAVFSRITDAVQAVWPDDNDVAAVALGAPGPLNFRTGILRFAPNLPGWVNVPLRDMLHRELGVPVYVANDADVAALAEHRFGAGQGVAHMIYMTISTGIGGGMIFNNRLFTGGHGLGGEVGHVGVDPLGPRHTCGNIGCLEVMASGTAIARRARERVAAGEPSIISDLVDGNLELVTAKTVSQAGQSGDPLAVSIFREAGTYIGSMLVGLMYILNPALFVLGGSVTLAGELLFGPIRETVADRAPEAYRELTQIVPAELGGDVGLWGALALALMELDA